MAMKKHFIELYKNYKIYIVSGTNPVLFIAEKDNPAKGSTLTAESLDSLKSQIDKKLDYALSIKINIYDGPMTNKIIQKNTQTRIRSCQGMFNGFSVVIESDYDMDVIVEMYENRPVRHSKKHKNKRPRSVIKILCRNKTTEYTRQ